MSIGRWRAFPPRTIVEAKQSALGCRAITQVRALTVAGQLYVNYAHDIHWNESTGTAEIYVGREWIALTRLGLESWATEEGLNILNPDNTVTLCADASDGDTPIFGMAPVGGGGGGALGDVLSTDDEILIDEVMHYLSEMRTSEMDDLSIHTLLAVGAFLMSPHNQSLRRAAVEAADRFFGSFVPGGSGGGGGVGSFYGNYYEVERVSEYAVKLIKVWAEAHIVSLGTKQTLALIESVANALDDAYRAGHENGWEERDQCEVEELDPGEELTDEDVVAIAEGGGDPGGQHKPLHSMTAAEAREYAQGVIAQAVAMCSDLNVIPGVSVKVEFEVIEDDNEDEPSVEIESLLGKLRMFTIDADNFEFRFPNSGRLAVNYADDLLEQLGEFYERCKDEIECQQNPDACEWADEDGEA